MRCPACQHNQRYRDGMRCSKCGYAFVLRKKADGLSDLGLQQIIRRLSDNGQYAFTKTQLVLEICRYWRRSTTQGMIGGLVVVAILMAVFGFATGFWLMSVIVGGVILFLMVWGSQRRKINLPLPKAHNLLQRYQQAHPIAELADGRAFLQQATAERPYGEDYAPERILIVERDEWVDLLVRNRFHLTHKTAVLSRSGYPQRVLDACRAFLRQHPQTPIQLLHDASLAGFNLRAQLTTDPNWPLAGHPLTDLGLSKQTLQNTGRLPWLPANPRHKGRLSADVTKMLSGRYRMPLDCLGPKASLSLIGAALLGGALLLPTPPASGDSSGGDFGGDDFG